MIIIYILIDGSLITSGNHSCLVAVAWVNCKFTKVQNNEYDRFYRCFFKAEIRNEFKSINPCMP